MYFNKKITLKFLLKRDDKNLGKKLSGAEPSPPENVEKFKLKRMFFFL